MVKVYRMHSSLLFNLVKVRSLKLSQLVVKNAEVLDGFFFRSEGINGFVSEEEHQN